MLESKKETVRLSSNQNWVDHLQPIPLRLIFRRLFFTLFHPTLPASSPAYDCVQLRVGSGGRQTWTDSESFLYPSQIPFYASAFQSARIPHSKVFLTSDSPDAARTFMQLANITIEELVRPIGEGTHIDRAHATLADFESVVSDFLAFRSCGVAFITERSGFGRYGLWLRQSSSGTDYVMKRHGINQLVPLSD